MNIYVASSWRNIVQPWVVRVLRANGHDVYDSGFSWSDIDPSKALDHPIAKHGYANDMAALRACDACVLVLPSGRSASFEFGYAMGQGKLCAVLLLDHVEPELMYREASIVTSADELLNTIRCWENDE